VRSGVFELLFYAVNLVSESLRGTHESGSVGVYRREMRFEALKERFSGQVCESRRRIIRKALCFIS
jgi:hypothetical protein